MNCGISLERALELKKGRGHNNQGSSGHPIRLSTRG